MKWYNFETSFVSLKNELAKMLKSAGIRYECSGAYDSYHFEILCSDANVKLINNWLDMHTIVSE